MQKDRYTPVVVIMEASTGDEEGDAALTPSRRSASISSEADNMERGGSDKMGAGRVLGETTPQQVTFRNPGMRDAAGKRVQYYPLVNVTQASMNIVANIAYMKVTQEIVKLRACVTDGPLLCRLLGVLAGSVLHLHAASLLIYNLASKDRRPWPPTLLHHLLASLLGAATVLLEARTLLCTAHMRKKTREYLKLLSFLWGRGVLCLIISSFLFLRYPNFTDMVLAGCFAALGAINIVVGVASQRRLHALRETLTEDEKVLKEKFDQHKDGHGKVKAADLADICASLGSRLSHDELEHAILTLDTNRCGEIEYEAFVDWFRSR